MSDSAWVLLVGQTPPPWHGQAVGTKILFDHDWPGLRLRTIRMAYSGEMDEVGRLAPHKLFHLVSLIRRTRRFLREHPGTTLFYPPTSPHWLPFLRDVIYLLCVRRLASRTVFLFHAGGFGEFVARSWLTRWIGRAYGRPDMCLEVAVETPSPHEVLDCPNWSWTPYGVAVPRVDRQRPDGTRPLQVLFVGSLQEGKGVLEIIRTVSALKTANDLANFRFSLVGRWFSDEFRREALKLVEDEGLGEFIRFPGQKTGDEKWEAYAKADIFFFPSHYAAEAFPFVVIEALGSGLPVLSTDWRGIPSIVEGSGAAWLCPVRSPESYAGALVEIGSTLRSGTRVSERAREFYESRYLPRHFIARVSEKLYPLLGLPVPVPGPAGDGATATPAAPPESTAPSRAVQVFNQYLERGGEEEWVDQMLQVSAPAIDLRTLRFQSRAWTERGRPNRLRQAFLIRDNPVSRRQLRLEVERSRPDALIFHNILPVGSLGLYDEAEELGLPIFQYIHNFRPFSPSGTLWSHRRVHDDALGGAVWPEILHAAWEGSTLKTALLAWHLRHFVTGGGLERVHHWIAVSDFMRSKFIDAGIPASKITTLRHCWHPGPCPPQEEGDYYLFLGRIVSEKGVGTLIDAWKLLRERLGAACPRLIIAGTGSEEARIHREASRLDRVESVGFVSGNAKQQLIARARAVVVPSIWWEPLGLTVYEAYEHRRPVLAAASGGLTETVRHGRTGYLHEPGNPEDLTESIIRIEDDGPELRSRMGGAGRAWLEEEASPDLWRVALSELIRRSRRL